MQIISEPALMRNPRNEVTAMTHYDTARINEMLGLQIGIIRNIALKLDGYDLERMERTLVELEDAVKAARSMIEGLPHRHQA
jgi:hypothetical protein